ncbi:esterase-like activity of phytase family protein [Niabella hibiscisoli]|uniref:esterase-like activity of phytase family protein n=1 Tax=Niabella hibiscisoli TaxID=1825928 RepID=UPI001F10531F|nr:esterase-like activity of phytase family protein [Niabella hibiscisoli]
MSFSRDYRYLWASMEGAIHEDGPLASAAYANAPVRFTKFDVKSKRAVGQYGYLLDAIAAEPIPKTAFSINGIPEILNISNNRFLVLERSFSTGVENCVIKIYLADFSQATNVSTTKSLYRNTNYKPATKKLLFNFNALERYIDNVEGITFGPVLPNGHASLILIADNNFNPKEKQQVFLFEIIP